MAVEHSGAEVSPGRATARADDAPAAGSAQPGSAARPSAAGSDARPSAAGSDARPDLDEVKRKFREALDRKHSTHATAEGAPDTGKVHGSHGPAASRRSFRRKSGG
jgi:Family of unknown function (DUF5302)